MSFVSSGMCLRSGQPLVPAAGVVPEKAGAWAALIPAGIAVATSRQCVVGEAVGVAADLAALVQPCSAGAYFWAQLSWGLRAAQSAAPEGGWGEHAACRSWVIPTPMQGAGGICTSSLGLIQVLARQGSLCSSRLLRCKSRKYQSPCLTGSTYLAVQRSVYWTLSTCWSVSLRNLL